MKIRYMNDLFHSVLAFAVLAVTAIALKGCAEWSDLVCALIGSAAAETALFGKEFYDKVVKKKFFDWRDIRIGQIGVVAGFICVCLWM